MKFKITVANKGDLENSWDENYDEDIEDPQEWAEYTVKQFNNTLRPMEKERVLIGVKKIV